MKVTVWLDHSRNTLGHATDTWEPKDFDDEDAALAFMQTCGKPFRVTTELRLRIAGMPWLEDEK